MQYNLQTTLPTNLEITSNKNYKKPASWPDIRKNTENGHIYLLVDDRYPIGLTATATGGYSVKIDNTAYADYNSGAQFSMADWSAYSDTEGYTIDYPAGASKAHIIDIYPQSESENITAFRCSRVAASGNESQGILWAHFNLTNKANITQCFCGGTYSNVQYNNNAMLAITAKNNTINMTGFDQLVGGNAVVEYMPVFISDETARLFIAGTTGKVLEKITIKNFVCTNRFDYAFGNAQSLKQINFVNCQIAPQNLSNAFTNVYSLPKLPQIDFTNATNMTSFLTNAESLQDTVLDVSAATGLTRIGCYGSAEHFMAGFKGLRVSNQAPFTGTSSQINVSYTGMDRTALVQLFNDLPTVSDGQVINITGCTGSPDLTDDDKAIATEKGWSITD